MIGGKKKNKPKMFKFSSWPSGEMNNAESFLFDQTRKKKEKKRKKKSWIVFNIVASSS